MWYIASITRLVLTLSAYALYTHYWGFTLRLLKPELTSSTYVITYYLHNIDSVNIFKYKPQRESHLKL